MMFAWAHAQMFAWARAAVCRLWSPSQRLCPSPTSQFSNNTSEIRVTGEPCRSFCPNVPNRRPYFRDRANKKTSERGWKDYRFSCSFQVMRLLYRNPAASKVPHDTQVFKPFEIMSHIRCYSYKHQITPEFKVLPKMYLRRTSLPSAICWTQILHPKLHAYAQWYQILAIIRTSLEISFPDTFVRYRIFKRVVKSLKAAISSPSQLHCSSHPPPQSVVAKNLYYTSLATWRRLRTIPLRQQI